MHTIAELSDLVNTGHLAEAKRAAATLLTDADPRDLQVIDYCANILDTWPKIGVAKLRAYWLTANEHDRALIATCVRERANQPHREPSEIEPPRWTGANKHEAPRDLRHEVRPELKRAPRARDDSAADAYFRERTNPGDENRERDTPTGYELDYDRAAVPALRGTPCVSCWLEPATYDRTSHHDGLCTECRDRGRPGIPPLPDGHTRLDVIQARCAFLADRYPTAALRLLRRYWQQCDNEQDRTTVADWVCGHDFTIPESPTAPADNELRACRSCCDPRTPRDTRNLATDDGLCASCRSVDQSE